MQVVPIINIQNTNFNKTNSRVNFNGLNLKNVSPSILKHIKNELPMLEEISKKYDIDLKSCYEGIYDMESIDIVVKPLKETLNFWTKLFGPKGKSTFYLNKNEKSFVDKVNDAINEFNSKNTLGDLIDTFE